MSVARADLSEAKRILLEKLLRGEATRQSLEAPLPERAPGAPVPLAPSQQPIWLHAQMAGDARIYNESQLVRYRGRMDRAVLERALNELVRRHEALRTVFAHADSAVVQVIFDSLQLSLPMVDLSGHAAAAREAELRRLVRTEAQRPFDLAVGPLIRVKLFRMAEDDYRLFVVNHHIVLDGLSLVGVLLPELATLYDAFSKGQESPLAEPRHQYADFALWQRRFLDNDSAAAQVEYWRKQLAPPIPTLQLPTDRPRQANPSYQGEVERFLLGSKLDSAVARFCERTSVTPNTLLLAAFKALLFRYGGQNDILLGSVMDIRQRPEFQNLVGFFVNTVVLRTHPTGNRTFREFLREVEEAVHGAIANRDVPLDELIRVLHPHRDVATQPLFQVVFSFPPRTKPADARWHWDPVYSGMTKFDILLEVEETAEGLVGNLSYNSSLFESATIRAMIEHFQTLLTAAIERPDTLLASLPLLTDLERYELTAQWNGPVAEVPETSVPALIRKRSRERAGAVAVRCGGEQMTYGELEQRSDGYAWRLREAGVGRESLVGIRMKRSCEMVAALVGVLKTGGAYLPVDPALPIERQRFLLEDGQAAMLLTDQPLAEDLKIDPGKVMLTGERAAGHAFPDVFVAPEDLAYVIYTSGSTGLPKGAEIPHGAFLNLALAVAAQPGFTAEDTMLAFATLSFDAAVSEIFVPLIMGGCVVLATEDEQQDPVRLLERMRACACTMMQATPATWRALVEAGWDGDKRLKVLSAGETLPRDLAAQLAARSAELWNMYGPTETTVYAVIHRVSSWEGPIPIGRPIANTRIWVLDPDHNPVPPGATGEVYIGGRGLARGYRRRAELTAQRFVSIPSVDSGRLYRTGDLARWLPNGILEYLGRADNQVKIRGFRVEVEEIEAALNQQPEVRASAVKAWPDPSGNMTLAAYVVAPKDTDVRTGLRTKLPHYMVPAHVVYLDALPLNPNGKVDRKTLPRPAAEGEAVTELRCETERQLAAIWESILDRRRIGRDDNFFELGGHSLLVTRLIRNIEQSFGRKISMASIFEAPTVAELAALLESDAAQTVPRRIVHFQPVGHHPPLFWTDAGPNFRDLAAHLSSNHPLIGLSLTLDEREEFSQAHSRWMEDVAARLVRSVRARQPQGPYFLGGWCASGMLAYEMAVQLRAAGQEVGLLILLDSPNYQHYQSLHPLRVTADRFVWHLRRLRRMPPQKLVRYAWDRARAFFAQPTRASKPPEVPEEYQAFVQAAYGYQLKPYDGKILAISPEDRPAFADLNESWRDAPVTSLRVVDVSGDHNSCMHEPNVAHLAACIDQALHAAETSLEAPTETPAVNAVAR